MPDYEEIAQGIIEDAERAPGSMLDFMLGLKVIRDTIAARIELSRDELDDDDIEVFDAS